jgi:hypothetical protein
MLETGGCESSAFDAFEVAEERKIVRRGITKSAKMIYKALGLQFRGETRDLGCWGFDRC